MRLDKSDFIVVRDFSKELSFSFVKDHWRWTMSPMDIVRKNIAATYASARDGNLGTSFLNSLYRNPLGCFFEVEKMMRMMIDTLEEIRYRRNAKRIRGLASFFAEGLFNRKVSVENLFGEQILVWCRTIKIRHEKKEIKKKKFNKKQKR